MEGAEVGRIALDKCPSGIVGLDEITGGGLPRGRPTLVCGAAGCGKTLLAIEFLVKGAIEYDEPGVLMAFEETENELAANVALAGFRPATTWSQERSWPLTTFTSSGAKSRRRANTTWRGCSSVSVCAIDTIGAKRVVLDTIETLFSGLSNAVDPAGRAPAALSLAEGQGRHGDHHRPRGATGPLTRHGLEEYVSDCVILLDHRVSDQVATRRIRIVKYRGSTHGTNEYPFLIDEQGHRASCPSPRVGLDHVASTDRVLHRAATGSMPCSAARGSIAAAAF